MTPIFKNLINLFSINTLCLHTNQPDLSVKNVKYHYLNPMVSVNMDLSNGTSIVFNAVKQCTILNLDTCYTKNPNAKSVIFYQKIAVNLI
jgi:hypothetical protein